MAVEPDVRMTKYHAASPESANEKVLEFEFALQSSEMGRAVLQRRADVKCLCDRSLRQRVLLKGQALAYFVFGTAQAGTSRLRISVYKPLR